MKKTAGELIKAALQEKRVTQVQLAEMLGLSKKIFYNKLYRNAFSVEALEKALDLLGYDLTATNRKTGETINPAKDK